MVLKALSVCLEASARGETLGLIKLDTVQLCTYQAFDAMLKSDLRKTVNKGLDRAPEDKGGGEWIKWLRVISCSMATHMHSAELTSAGLNAISTVVCVIGLEFTNAEGIKTIHDAVCEHEADPKVVACAEAGVVLVLAQTLSTHKKDAKIALEAVRALEMFLGIKSERLKLQMLEEDASRAILSAMKGHKASVELLVHCCKLIYKICDGYTLPYTDGHTLPYTEVLIDFINKAAHVHLDVADRHKQSIELTRCCVRFFSAYCCISDGSFETFETGRN